jgi:hypothetical protein
MVELLPYFAGLIMVLFGIAFYSAMSAFRKMAKTTEASTRRDEAASDKAASDKAN